MLASYQDIPTRYSPWQLMKPTLNMSVCATNVSCPQPDALTKFLITRPAQSLYPSTSSDIVKSRAGRNLSQCHEHFDSATGSGFPLYTRGTFKSPNRSLGRHYFHHCISGKDAARPVAILFDVGRSYIERSVTRWAGGVRRTGGSRGRAGSRRFCRDGDCRFSTAPGRDARG